MQYLVTHRAPRRAQPFITLNKMIVRGASQVLSAPETAGARRESGDRRLWVTEEAGGQPAAQLCEDGLSHVVCEAEEGDEGHTVAEDEDPID